MDIDKRTAQQMTNAITDLRRSVDELNKTLKAAQRPKPSITNVYGENVKNDEGTMTKVYDALRECGYLPDDIPGVISAFQNRGILFRERA